MSQNEAQSRGFALSLSKGPRKSRSDFVRQFGQFVQPRRVGLVLVGDERSAQFEKNEFGHALTLAYAGMTVKRAIIFAWHT